ncbi:hypothetical protein DIPPA_24077 [Diplonema papillatum]|nr:hypothetical protein DIPPA_24077 [Diplonema papillatum]
MLWNLWVALLTSLVAEAAAQNAPEDGGVVLILGMGWGLFSVLLCTFLFALLAFAAFILSDKGWLVACLGVVVTVVFLIVLLSCPTHSDDDDRAGSKTDGTARSRVPIVAITAVAFVLLSAVQLREHFSEPEHFVPRPRRGPRLHAKLKEAIRAAVS